MSSNKVKKDMQQLLTVINKINQELKGLKKHISSTKSNDNTKSVMNRIEQIEKSTSSASNLSKNIKDYIDLQIECKLEESLENINIRFDKIDNLYKKILSHIALTSSAYKN